MKAGETARFGLMTSGNALAHERASELIWSGKNSDSPHLGLRIFCISEVLVREVNRGKLSTLLARTT